jgi:hypothetical protein
MGCGDDNVSYRYYDTYTLQTAYRDLTSTFCGFQISNTHLARNNLSDRTQISVLWVSTLEGTSMQGCVANKRVAFILGCSVTLKRCRV